MCGLLTGVVLFMHFVLGLMDALLVTFVVFVAIAVGLMLFTFELVGIYSLIVGFNLVFFIFIYY